MGSKTKSALLASGLFLGMGSPAFSQDSLEILLDKGIQQETAERIVQDYPQMVGSTYMDDIAYLLNRGLDFETVWDMQIDHYKEIVTYFKEGRVDDSFLPLFTQDKAAASVAMAQADPDFKKGRDFAVSYIIEKSSQRTHKDRTDGDQDYIEDIDQIRNVQNSYLLSLIKQYVQYFETQKSNQLFKGLFSPYVDGSGEQHAVENLALVLQSEPGKLDAVLIDTRFPREDGDVHKYPSRPALDNYISLVGHIHNHLRVPDDSQAGPSGKKSGRTPFNDMNGLMSMQDGAPYNPGNPFLIGCAVAEISEGYNVNLYFRDVKKVEDKYVNIGDFIVLDIGTWPKVEE